MPAGDEGCSSIGGAGGLGLEVLGEGQEVHGGAGSGEGEDGGERGVGAESGDAELVGGVGREVGEGVA